jgi:hypothetical protein
VKVQPEILDTFSGGFHVAYMDRGPSSLRVVNAARTDLDPLALIIYFKTNFGL